MARPELKVLRFVSKCNDRHIQLVTLVSQTMIDSPPPLLLVELRDKGASSFWEVGDGKALIITNIQIMGPHRELYIVGVAGAGIIGAAQDVISDLRTIARELNCRFVGGLTGRGGWEGFATEHGFKKVATYYSLDLEMN